jgi:Fe-S cluster biosynthesis and repair protein YggX
MVSPEQMNKASSAGEWVGIPGMKGKRISDFMQQWSTSHLSLVSTAAAMEERAAVDAKEISGATDPLMGQATSSKESGFAAQTRIRQGMLTLEEQMDNLDKTKRQVLEMSIRNMQQFWMPEKIARIIGSEIADEEQPEQSVVTEFLANFTNTNFDVELDAGTNSPTMRAMKAEQVAQMIQMGFQNLFPLWLELSDIESADEIQEKMEEEKMAQMMMQQAQGQMSEPAKG